MEETISLKEIFEVLKKRIGMIIGITALAAIISAVVTIFVLTPQYQASSQFIVNQSQSEQSAQMPNLDSGDIQTNIQLINTYNVIIQSPAILEEVISEVGLDMSTGALSDKISVSSADQSQVVNVDVTDPSPETAVAIANTTVEVFRSEISEIMNVDNVSILSEAEVAENPSPVSPNTVLNIAIAIVVGLMIGVGIAFLLEYLDNTMKSEKDIDELLELPVMGVVSTISDKEVREAAEAKMNNQSNVVNVRRESIGS